MVLILNNIVSILTILFNTDSFIQNMDKPVCSHCVHYDPENRSFDSFFSKCKMFGSKNIQTGVVVYDYADSCRSDESKCGKKGIYFKPESNLCYKKIKQEIVILTPYFLLTIFIFLSIK